MKHLSGLTSLLHFAKRLLLVKQAHESGNFKMLVENLNYRAETLMKVWPKRFPTLEFAKQYERDPKKIANSVYAQQNGQ
jgi:putative chitinase